MCKNSHKLKSAIKVRSLSVFFSLQTDDFGVFKTSLSREMTIAAKHYGLNENDLKKLTVTAIQYTFASDLEKRQLIDKYFSLNSN